MWDCGLLRVTKKKRGAVDDSQSLAISNIIKNGKGLTVVNVKSRLSLGSAIDSRTYLSPVCHLMMVEMSNKYA